MGYHRSAYSHNLLVTSLLFQFRQQLEVLTPTRELCLVTLEPVLDQTFPLKDAARAQERLWRNENFGKITLDIPSPSGRG